LPAELRESLSRVFDDILREVLPPEKAREAVERLRTRLPQIFQITRHTSKMHSGPMPNVETAEGYERLLPGSVERMFAMAEKDQNAYIASNVDRQARDDRFRRYALGCGALALLTILAVVILLVYWKEPWVAGSVASLGIVGVLAALVNARLPPKTSEPKALPRAKD